MSLGALGRPNGRGLRVVSWRMIRRSWLDLMEWEGAFKSGVPACAKALRGQGYEKISVAGAWSTTAPAQLSCTVPRVSLGAPREVMLPVTGMETPVALPTGAPSPQPGRSIIEFLWKPLQKFQSLEILWGVGGERMCSFPSFGGMDYQHQRIKSEMHFFKCSLSSMKLKKKIPIFKQYARCLEYI